MLEPIFYLSTDVGGHSVRTSLYDRECNCLARFSEAVVTEKPRPGWVEHSPPQLVAAVTATVNQCLELVPPAARVVMGMSTQRSSIVCWNRCTREPLSAVLSWQDVRGAAYLEPLARQRRVIKRKTGLVLSPHYSASKIRWCLEHLPGVSECAPQDLVIAPLGAYLVSAVTARARADRPPLIDASNAARTMLVDLETCDWDPALLQAFGIPRACLPAVVDNHSDFGTGCFLRPVDLRLLIADQSAALFATGRHETETGYINIGSGAFVLGLTDSAPADDRLLVSLVYKQGERRLFALEGTVNGAANALSWFQQQCGAAAVPAYHALKRGQIEPGCFLNAVGGLGSPWWCAQCSSRFVTGDSVEAKWMAVYESILFLLYCNFRRLREHLPGLAQIRVSGGLSADPAYCQALANLLDVRILHEQVEASSNGVACLLAGIERLVPSAGRRFQPQDDQELHNRFRYWERQMHAYTGIDKF